MSVEADHECGGRSWVRRTTMSAEVLTPRTESAALSRRRQVTRQVKTGSRVVAVITTCASGVGEAAVGLELMGRSRVGASTCSRRSEEAGSSRSRRSFD